MTSIDDRLAALEARLAALESRLGAPRAPAPAPIPAQPEPPPRAARAQIPDALAEARSLAPDQRAAQPAPRAAGADPAATAATSFGALFLGWSGGFVLLLAASYLVMLALQSGWLTPLRQVTLAALGGIGMIVVGVALRRDRPDYAGLLPGVGLAILYIACYGAHLGYGLIDQQAALATVCAISVLALVLARTFDSGFYGLAAVTATYLTPLLLPEMRGDLTALAVYYTAWSVVFCGHSLWYGTRTLYMVAMFMAVVGFDATWRATTGGAWYWAVVYQCAQLGVFLTTAASFSILHERPLEEMEGWVHFLALLVFYLLVYEHLERNLPVEAPLIALASILPPVLAYRAARASLGAGSAPVGALLVSGYSAWVLLHAGYLEFLPSDAQPWIVLVAAVVLGLLLRAEDAPRATLRPFAWMIGSLFALNYLRVVFGVPEVRPPAVELLDLLYAGALYALYFGWAAQDARERYGTLIIYAAHLAALVGLARLLDGSLLVSLLWAGMALAWLAAGIARRDRLLGSSSLLLFAMAGVKVVFLDLRGVDPVVRIVTLALVGAALYVGGWYYQNLVARTTED